MIKYFFLFPLLALMMSSCLVFHSGNVGSGPQLHKGDQFVDIGVGESKSVFVLGIGNLKKDNLIYEAKKNLYLNRPLGTGEYYANITTSITNKFIFFVVHITKVGVSADIIKSGDTLNEAFSKNFKQLIGYEYYLRKTQVAEKKP